MTAVLENETGTTTSHVLFIRSDTLERAIYNALLHACKPSDNLPLFACVRFEFDGSELTTVATNRYRMSWETVESDPSMEAQTGEPFAFSLSADAAKNVLATLKAAKHQTVALRYAAPNETLLEGSIEFQTDSSTVQYTPSENSFPDWRRLIPSDETRIERDHIRLNVTYLTDLAKVKCERKHPAVKIELHNSATKPNAIGPVLVRFDDGPSILIMPVRGPED